MIELKTMILILLIFFFSGCAETTHFPRCNHNATSHYKAYISWADSDYQITEEAYLNGWIRVESHMLPPGNKYGGYISALCSLSYEVN